MSLKQWADNGWLRPHQSSKQVTLSPALSFVFEHLDRHGRTETPDEADGAFAFEADHIDRARISTYRNPARPHPKACGC